MIRRALSTLLAAALVLVLALAAAATGCGGDGDAAGPAVTTAETTLADPDADGFLADAPGEPLRPRRELLGPGARPPRTGATIATLAQLSDPHVRDEESPARAPFLDRLGSPFTSTFRPHEALSGHVLAAAVRAVNRVRPQAVAVTGDIVDSAQENEHDQALAILQGGRVDPDTGGAGGRPRYDGVQAASNPDPLYYRPDFDAPRHPGILAAAQRPFTAPGLRAPWYPAIGNHDVLVQGETPPTPAIEAVATGRRVLTSLDPDFRPDTSAGSAAAVESLLGQGAPGRAVDAPADPRRRHLPVAELIARLRRGGAAADRLDYTFDVGAQVRAIVLDTVDRGGGSRGRVDPAQVAWLRGELARVGERWVVVFAHNPLETSAGGDEALAAIDTAPRAIAVVTGHRHRNTIEPRRVAGGGGYWLIGTSSLADFPQQARFFRLVRTAGGGVALETAMVDHDGRGLAGVARELAHLDAQGGRPQGFAGRRQDRNARLYLPAP